MYGNVHREPMDVFAVNLLRVGVETDNDSDSDKDSQSERSDFPRRIMAEKDSRKCQTGACTI